MPYLWKPGGRSLNYCPFIHYWMNQITIITGPRVNLVFDNYPDQVRAKWIYFGS
ncbi:MAG: hypothetical protein ACI9YL_001425 [Luteibaculaceae bacterium]|jgi:hypothetical protein